MSETAEHRSGFVAVVGRPNVGKSTLVNALVGAKISIVTSKPHTTRHSILGILTRPGFQIVFIDTPGLDSGSRKLMNKALNRAATGALDFANIALLVCEAGVWKEGDDQVLEHVRRVNLPCVAVVNKIDKVRPRDRLLPYLHELSQRHEFLDIVPVSATAHDNLSRLETTLVDRLPDQEALYPAEMQTDRGIRFRAAEILREKLMDSLRQEVPYGVGVEILELGEDEDGRLNIDAVIWVDRESHKGIVIGHGGKVLKHVGQAARLEMQDSFGRPVRLDSRVKVKKNWSDNAEAIRQLGYDGGQ